MSGWINSNKQDFQKGWGKIKNSTSFDHGNLPAEVVNEIIGEYKAAECRKTIIKLENIS